MVLFVKSAEELSDEDFIKAFEGLNLDIKLFNHAQHIRLGWIYLKTEPNFTTAMDRLRSSILSFASYHGATGKYHETITKFYLTIIEKFMVDGENWLEFQCHNELLFQNSRPMIFTYYSESLISTLEARSEWVEPDRLKL
ncbi:MAG: hypothetical protein ACKVIX_03490 [Sphingomonadales bacterium]|jgi:hypothetical protein